MNNLCKVIISAVCLLSFATAQQKESAMEQQPKLYSFVMKTIDGNDKPLSEYNGKVLMIVNVASKCGHTPQYKALEQLYEKYKNKGFVILGFPANNFLWQEPGTDAEIKQFCTLNYSVTFDMFSKIDVKGKNQHPLYKYLTEETSVSGKVEWNFQKYLVDRHGTVTDKFSPKTEPDDVAIIAAVEKLLSEK
jgi:glutathione peroxidase